MSFLQGHLLVVFGVHEVMAFTIAVEIFKIDFVDGDFLERIFRAEPVIDHRAGAEVAHLGLHSGALVAGRAVIDAVDREEIALVLDDHSRAE